MGTEVGKITRINDQEMTIQLSKGEHCNVCAAKSVCSFEGPDSSYRFITIPTEKGAKIGSEITLEYKESYRILAAFTLFLTPILFILLGYFLADHLFEFTNRGIAGAFVGLGFSGIVLFLLNNVFSKSGVLLPKVRDG